MGHRSPGFWQLQCGGWLLLYLLCLAGSAPHLHESYILAYNTWVVVILFAVTLALRPALLLAQPGDLGGGGGADGRPRHAPVKGGAVAVF